MKARMLAAALAVTMMGAFPALAQETLPIGFTVSQTGKLNND